MTHSTNMKLALNLALHVIKNPAHGYIEYWLFFHPVTGGDEAQSHFKAKNTVCSYFYFHTRPLSFKVIFSVLYPLLP